MEDIIHDFFYLVKNKKIEIYNEFSLQHELGIFLREKYKGSKIQFERNVSYFDLDKSNFKKNFVKRFGEQCGIFQCMVGCMLQWGYTKEFDDDVYNAIMDTRA